MSWTNVEVTVLKIGKRMRARVTAVPAGTFVGTGNGSVITGKWVQLPKAVLAAAVPGDRFLIEAEVVNGTKASFITMVPGTTAMKVAAAPSSPPPSAAPVAAIQTWAPPGAAPAKRVLTPDEVIESGRDVTCKPSSTARVVYGSATRRLGKESASTAAADLRHQAVRHAKRLEEWPAFVRELFARLYDNDGCKPLSDEERSAWGTSALGALEAQPEWDALREASQVSRAIASESAALLADAVSTAMGLDRVTTDEASRRDPRELEEEREAGRRMLESLGADQDQIDAFVVDSGTRIGAAVGVRGVLDQQVDRVRPGFRNALKTIAASAAKKAEVVKAMAGIGFSREGPGSVEEVCPELLAVLDPRMLAILKWAGRFKEAANGELARADGHCDVIGIVPTGNLAKLTPRSKMELASGGIRGLAMMRDVLEGAAQGWEQRDQQPKKRGDVLLLQDQSGSMSGEPEVRARALSVAALLVLLQQRRRVCACGFSGAGDAPTQLVTPGDLRAMGLAVKLLCRKARGGTDVDGAIKACVKAVNASPVKLSEADVLVTTDGIFDRVAAEVLALLGERRLFGVLIGMPDDGSHPEFDALWPIIGNIEEKDAAAAINAMRSPRRKRKSPPAVSASAGVE